MTIVFRSNLLGPMNAGGLGMRYPRATVFHRSTPEFPDHPAFRRQFLRFSLHVGSLCFTSVIVPVSHWTQSQCRD